MLLLDDVKVIYNFASFVFWQLLNVNVCLIEHLHMSEAVILDDERTEVFSMLSYRCVKFAISCTSGDDVNWRFGVLVDIVRIRSAIKCLVLVNWPKSL